MKHRPGSCNIVLVGAWNPAIITPGWLGEHIFKVADLRFDVMVSSLGGQRVMRFPTEGVEVALEGGRLQLSPMSLIPANMDRAEQVARAVLETLLHTPITACGINYGFQASTLPAELAWIGSLPDDNALSELGSVAATRVHRTLQVDAGFGDPALNVKLQAGEDGAFMLDLNYHYDKQGSRQLAASLEGAFQGLLPHVRQVLGAYQITCEVPLEESGEDGELDE